MFEQASSEPPKLGSRPEVRDNYICGSSPPADNSQSTRLVITSRCSIISTVVSKQRQVIPGTITSAATSMRYSIESCAPPPGVRPLPIPESTPSSRRYSTYGLGSFLHPIPGILLPPKRTDGSVLRRVLTCQALLGLLNVIHPLRITVSGLGTTTLLACSDLAFAPSSPSKTTQ